MNKALVSIITPCYNGSKFVHRLLDSILIQSYPFIEMYLIDDGSTDDTALIIKSYIDKFESKGYLLNYIYQENSGQSVALNKGLKLFQGEFLTWPDSDDFYASNCAIETMVRSLEKTNDNVSMVRSSVNLLDETSLMNLGFLGKNVLNKEEVNLFEDSFFERRNFWFQPISYMVKSKYVIELIKDRDIYTNKDAGQNWQILLPLLYNHKCCLLDVFLCNVLVRSNSHSKGSYDTFDKINIRNMAHEKTLINTLDRMFFLTAGVKDSYIKKAKEKYQRLRFELSKQHMKNKSLIKVYNNMREKHPHIVTLNDTFFYIISYIPFLLHIVICKNKILNRIKWLYVKN